MELNGIHPLRLKNNHFPKSPTIKILTCENTRKQIEKKGQGVSSKVYMKHAKHHLCTALNIMTVNLNTQHVQFLHICSIK